MRNASARIVLTFLILVLTFGATACNVEYSAAEPLLSTATTIPPLDPATATLEQILNRTRAAMGQVTSFKTRGTLVAFPNPEGFDGTIETFSEWQSPDRVGWLTKAPEDPGDYRGGEGLALTVEGVTVGDHTFIRMSDEPGSEWHEQPHNPNRLSSDPFSALLLLLDASNIELVTTNEATNTGDTVYRLEFGGYPVTQSIDPERLSEEELTALEHLSSRTRTTLLIDRESFRYVTVITTQRPEDPTKDEAIVKAIMAGSINTTYYYDYNVPLVIELPTENIRLLDSNPLATPDIPPSPAATFSAPSKASEYADP
ncbi:MAG: hypothetical protein O3B95_02375 [Chloroflexi bacterium]|nr:hypothetical protein [Chloroflexota bacterium]